MYKFAPEIQTKSIPIFMLSKNINYKENKNSFWEGFKEIFNLFGSTVNLKNVKLHTPQEAMKLDFKMVGYDIKMAMKKLDKEYNIGNIRWSKFK